MLDRLHCDVKNTVVGAKEKILETFVDIDSAEHHQLPGGDVNALYSKINFENMAKEIWSGRWDGRGRDFKPDWVNRLTFSRVGLGGKRWYFTDVSNVSK